MAGRLGHAQPSTTLNRYTEFLHARDQYAADKIGEILAPQDKNYPREGLPRVGSGRPAGVRVAPRFAPPVSTR